MVKNGTYSSEEIKTVLGAMSQTRSMLDQIFQAYIEEHKEIMLMSLVTDILLRNGECVRAEALVRNVSLHSGIYSPYLKCLTDDGEIKEIPMREVSLEGKFSILLWILNQ